MAVERISRGHRLLALAALLVVAQDRLIGPVEAQTLVSPEARMRTERRVERRGEVPRFDIDATCRAAPSLAGGIQNPFDSCVREEKAARAKLASTWKRHTAQQRRECSALERSSGSPSYVDVLTCLEMYAANAGNPSSSRR